MRSPASRERKSSPETTMPRLLVRCDVTRDDCRAEFITHQFPSQTRRPASRRRTKAGERQNNKLLCTDGASLGGSFRSHTCRSARRARNTHQRGDINKWRRRGNESICQIISLIDFAVVIQRSVQSRSRSFETHTTRIRNGDYSECSVAVRRLIAREWLQRTTLRARLWRSLSARVSTRKSVARAPRGSRTATLAKENEIWP